MFTNGQQTLQLIRNNHIQSLLQIASDSRIAQTSGVPENCSEKDIEQWITRSHAVPAEEMHYVIAADKQALGCCILKKIDWHKREAELSYWIGTAHWGRGLGTAAARLMAKAAFDILGITTLNAHYLKAGNAPSGRILAKLGFVEDSIRPDLPAEGRFLKHHGDVWTFVTLNRTTFT